MLLTAKTLCPKTSQKNVKTTETKREGGRVFTVHLVVVAWRIFNYSHVVLYTQLPVYLVQLI